MIARIRSLAEHRPYMFIGMLTVLAACIAGVAVVLIYNP